MDSIEKLAIKIDHEFRNGMKLEDMGWILKEYCGNDWTDYERYSEISYTRNLAFRNECFEIMVICWNYGQRSCIHDHPSNGCFLKVLKGDLIEESYKMIDSRPTIIKTINLPTGTIAYQQGKTGIHRIINPHDYQQTVTLHIYSPPNYVFNAIKN